MEKDISLSFAKATTLGIFLPLPIAIVFLQLFLHFWGLAEIANPMKNQAFLLTLMITIIAGSVFHELVHGLSWIYFGRKPLRSIRYGIHWKSLSPYAHCSEPIDARAYRIGCVMPYLLEGLLPSILALITGFGWLLIFGFVFTMGAGGDLLVLWIIRKVEPALLVLDHPTRVGCSVLLPDEEK
jgi:hypothetical protein